MTLQLLHEAAEGAAFTVDSIEPIASVLDEQAPDRALLCARCGHAITGSAARIAVNGQHAWTRQNPHGYIHYFGCFGSAPGCVSVGVPTRKDTWFADYFWQLQHCGGCDVHLGWLFFGGVGSEAVGGAGAGAGVFWGLLLDALVEERGLDG